ncbi:MAG: hypothetical protein H7Z41_19685 [Cytophagales bacterium]|nr:hypothetical protein [Armatimonadota bacterium]
MPLQQNLRTIDSDNSAATFGPASYSAAPPAYPHRSWPDAVAFREAVQHPEVTFSDPALKRAEVSLDRRGLPVAYSGRFAIVFRLNGEGEQKWAARCFTSGTEEEERRARYFLIARYMEELGDFAVPFRYLDQGIFVNGEWFPVLTMPWVSAPPMGRFVEKNLDKPEALRRLCGTLSALLGKLEETGISHGDWQHDNLLVAEGGTSVTLVDYDGVYVPEFAGRLSPEAGHPNYQHPQRGAEDFGPGQDRFSCLVIQAALLALSHDPSLWSRFSDGESLLFKRSDLAAPSASPLFYALRELAERSKDPVLADTLACLEDACYSAVGSTLPPVVPATEIVAPQTAMATPPSAAPAALTPLAATPPWYATSLSGKKWWQEGEVTLSSASGHTAYRVTAPPKEVFAYIERLTHPEVLTEENKNLWQARVIVPLIVSLTVLSLFWILRKAHFFPFYIFFWLFNLGNIGYAKWPRRKIYDELSAEIKKMQRLIEERKQRLSNRRAALGMSGTLQDFVADRLRKKSLQNTMSPPYNASLDTLHLLRAAGIDNALQLLNRSAVPGVPSHDMASLTRWVQTLEMEAQSEYRRLGGSPQAMTAEMSRLQDEISEFERHVAQLSREKEAFPNCSFGAYCRRLIGRPEPGTVSGRP